MSVLISKPRNISSNPSTKTTIPYRIAQIKTYLQTILRLLTRLVRVESKKIPNNADGSWMKNKNDSSRSEG